MLLIEHEDIIKRAHALPPLPQSAARLAGLLFNPDCDHREIIDVIECDATLTMKLLRVANSVLGATRHRVGTVREALLRLGTGTVAGFVFGTSVNSLVEKTIPGYQLTGSQFWTHSLTAAFAAESIQAHASNYTGQLAFTASLLHDIGKLVMGQFLSEELQKWIETAISEGKQTRYEAEKEVLSLHHGEAGGIIAQHWGLPDQLVRGIIFHHDPDEAGDQICHVTYLANLVAHQLEEDPSSIHSLSPWEPRNVSRSLRWLGLDEKHLVNVCRDAQERLQNMTGQMD